jgi:hypothetical protein
MPRPRWTFPRIPAGGVKLRHVCNPPRNDSKPDATACKTRQDQQIGGNETFMAIATRTAFNKPLPSTTARQHDAVDLHYGDRRPLPAALAIVNRF